MQSDNGTLITPTASQGNPFHSKERTGKRKTTERIQGQNLLYTGLTTSVALVDSFLIVILICQHHTDGRLSWPSMVTQQSNNQIKIYFINHKISS